MTGEREAADGMPKPSQQDKKKTDQATADNDLTTGHTTPGDGGDDNARDKKSD